MSNNKVHLAASNPKPVSRRLNSWIATYAEYTYNTEAPAEFHMWTAVSTLAGALNRRCWVDMGTFNIYPSMYIIFVAPPGIATKSSTAALGNEMLDNTEVISMASNSGSWQAMIDEMKESERQFQPGESKPMITISPMHVFASELGTFLNMKDGGQLDVLSDLWDGKPNFKRRTRATGEINIIRPYLNLLGCTTPKWLMDNVEEYLIGGGLFSRTLFVYADRKEKLIAYPDPGTNKFYKLKEDLEYDLKLISKLRGPFTLTDEAKKWGTEWYIKTHRETPAHIAGDKFQGYLARRQNHLHKTAMVVSASESPDMVITKQHLEVADGMLYMTELNLKEIYDSLVTDDKVAAYKLVKSIIRQKKKTTKPDLFRELSHQLSLSDFEDSIKSLLFTGEVVESQQAGRKHLCWRS